MDPVGTLPHREGRDYQWIDEAKVRRALLYQSQRKAPDPDRLSFSNLGLLWEWDASHITALIRHSLRLGHHPGAWKHAKKVMLRNPKKLNYTTVNTYCVISLLNYLGKVCNKVLADMLSEWCEVNHVFQQGQMGSRRQTSVIDVVTRVAGRVQVG